MIWSFFFPKLTAKHSTKHPHLCRRPLCPLLAREGGPRAILLLDSTLLGQCFSDSLTFASAVCNSSHSRVSAEWKRLPEQVAPIVPLDLPWPTLPSICESLICFCCPGALRALPLTDPSSGSRLMCFSTLLILVIIHIVSEPSMYQSCNPKSNILNWAQYVRLCGKHWCLDSLNEHGFVMATLSWGWS